jgi:hypothetical protein
MNLAQGVESRAERRCRSTVMIARQGRAKDLDRAAVLKRQTRCDRSVAGERFHWRAN